MNEELDLETESLEDESLESEDLLEFLKHALGCTYISDLRTEQYNYSAKLLLGKIDLRYFSLNSIKHAIDYIYFDSKNANVNGL